MKLSSPLLFFIFLLCLSLTADASANSQKKKVLYVDSYNANIWSATIEKGIHSVFDKHPEIELRVFHMDTKQSNSEEQNKASALNAKNIIDEWQPDIVLFSDDNAAKYLVAPYFRNSKIPFIFGGINYDSSHYNFPPESITGMIETHMLEDTYKILRPYIKGNRIGFIGCDNLTSHKTYNTLTSTGNKKFSAVRFVKTFSELKKSFIELQSEVDALMLYDTYSVANFNLEEMIDFSLKHTIIPTFGTSYTTIKHTLLGTPEIGEEHGTWMANTALEIFNGKKIITIPTTINKSARLYLNMPIAKKLGIKFPIELLDSAYLIVDKPGKILYLNLFNQDTSQLQSNAEIRKGLLLSLKIQPISGNVFDDTRSDIEFKAFSREIKKNSDPADIHNLQTELDLLINKYQPSVIITTYNDTVQKLLDHIPPEFTIPVIICGPDWDISFKNTLKKNIIVQKNYQLLKKALKLAHQYSTGKKIGYLAISDNDSSRSLQELTKNTGINFSAGEFIDSWDSLKENFLKLQKKVDIICFFNICKIKDWDKDKARSFFMKNTTVPTIAFSPQSNGFSLIYIRQLALEQGWIAGKTALKIIFPGDNTDIPESINKSSILNINQEILKRLKFNDQSIQNTNNAIR